MAKKKETFHPPAKRHKELHIQKPIDDKNENGQFPEVYSVVYSSYIMHYNWLRNFK